MKQESTPTENHYPAPGDVVRTNLRSNGAGKVLVSKREDDQVITNVYGSRHVGTTSGDTWDVVFETTDNGVKVWRAVG